MAENYSLRLNPVNISPENFLSPPTEVHTGDVRSRIEEELGGFGKVGKIGIGTEIEVNFFINDEDPSLPSDPNPNYGKLHQRRIDSIIKEASAKHKKFGHLPGFEEVEKIGRISAEYKFGVLRSLIEYEDTIYAFREFIKNVSQNYGVLPVCFSQHIHISLIGNQVNLLANGSGESVTHSAGSVAPLLYLPEDFRSPEIVKFGTESKVAGGDKATGVDRLQIRSLPSEYAADPFLSLLFSLGAIRGVLKNRTGENEFEKTFSNIDSFEERYLRQVEQMSKSRTAIEIIGFLLLAKLCKTLKYYPKISKRELTVAQVKALV